jgi:hypothetical protein
MYEQRLNTGVFCDGLHTNYRIPKQGCTELDALNPSVYRKPCEHHHRYRIRHVAPDDAGGFPVRDGSRCQSVISKHTPDSIHHNECTAGSVQVVGQRTPFQPVIQQRLTAVETIEQMRCGKRLSTHDGNCTVQSAQ